MDSVTPAKAPAAHAAPPFLPLFVFCLLVLGYQGRDALLHPQLWAEDGTVFFQQQLGRLCPPLFEPYAGYLHAVPRLVTWLASATPYKSQPAVMNALAWLIAAWAFAFTTRRMHRYVPAWVTLAIIAFAPTSGEINGSITNAHWFLQFALFAIVFAPGDRTGKWWLTFATTLVMALSGPFSVAFSGLFIAAVLVAVAWPRSFRGAAHTEITLWLRRMDRAAIAGLLLGAAIQSVTLVFAPHRPGEHGAWGASVQHLMGTILPIHLLGEPILPPRGWVLIYACIGIMFLTGRGMRLEAKAYIFAVAAAGVGLALAGLAGLPRPYDLSFGFSDRYYILARFAFWWMVYAGFAGHLMDRVQAGASVVLLVAFFGAMSPGLHRRWPMAQLPWKEQVRLLKQPGHHSIPINPYPFSIEVNTDLSGKPSGGPAPR